MTTKTTDGWAYSFTTISGQRMTGTWLTNEHGTMLMDEAHTGNKDFQEGICMGIQEKHKYRMPIRFQDIRFVKIPETMIVDFDFLQAKIDKLKERMEALA